jgi:Na+-translocating ferredoxin:NAD+ oxidoreductase subunit G
MAHGNDSILKSGGNLAMACILSGAVIAGTYAITAPVAAEQAVNQKAKAMRELVPDGQKFEPIAGKTEWYSVLKDGKTIAYIVPAEGKGYGGAIKMVAAVTPDGKAIDYKILSHNETPGLGDNATKDQFRKQFKGKAAADLTVVKTPTDKNIQALTGATITSKAVTLSIQKAVEEVTQYTSNK